MQQFCLPRLWYIHAMAAPPDYLERVHAGVLVKLIDV